MGFEQTNLPASNADEAIVVFGPGGEKHVFGRLSADLGPPRQAEPTKGDILIVTDNLAMVFSLREELRRGGYSLTWTNNFWVALSYLHDRVFTGLVLDLRVESVEERFILQFLEEYDVKSRGAKALLSSDAIRPALKKQMEEMGYHVLVGPVSPRSLLKALELPEHAQWNIRSHLEETRID